MNSPVYLDPAASRWWVIKARPRCEKKIQALLEEQGQSVFLPCRASRREYASKSVTFTVPLFPGYVFARFSPLQKASVLATTPSAGLIEVIDQRTFIQQIDTLRELLHRTRDVNVCPFIEQGKRVRITSGKFRGMEGMITRYSRKKRLILSLDLLRQSIEVELPAEAVVLAA
ncbi:MAG: transcription termination/antitermination NusG family protein [Verrucomicrobiota bacterium]